MKPIGGNQDMRVEGFAAGLRRDMRRVASVRVQTTQHGTRPYHSMLPLRCPKLRRAQSAVTLDEVRKKVWTPYAVDVVVSRLQECGISADDTAAMLWKQRHDDTLHDREQTPASRGHDPSVVQGEGENSAAPNSNPPSRSTKPDKNLPISVENSSGGHSVKESKTGRKFVRATRSAPVRRVCHVCGGCLPPHNNGKNTLITTTYPALSTTHSSRTTGIIRPATADVTEIKGILKRLDTEEESVRSQSCQFPDREVTFRLDPAHSDRPGENFQCSCGNRTSFEVLSASPGRQLKRENGRYKPCTMTMTFPGRKMWNLDDCTPQLGQTYYAYRAQRLKQQGELRKAIEEERRLHFARVAGDRTDPQKLTNVRTKSARTLTRRSVSSMF
ncbi:PREDICTED: uncharacterized protein LOC109463558 [Branchiostoma belcheri]|uniref:Uncharacterized protein LOC109463558 n=1 Tax=Branchiostoma belcheri TaxID=7741 RepID=A0A6P4YG26_BRABE|nr:PREDICTED: uncharacterized protein LOC109463558 [Branchiostoma belcheri]